jgi:hypothetical protein
MKANLSAYPRVAAVRVARIFGLYSNTDTIDRNVFSEGRRFEGVQAQHWMYYFLVAFGIGGLVVLRRRRFPISPLVSAVVAVIVSVAGTFAIYRYRLAADVALMAAAAVALVAGSSWAWRTGQARYDRLSTEPAPAETRADGSDAPDVDADADSDGATTREGVSSAGPTG